jgi:predicted protein tyrosine phosphatase
MVAKPKFRVLFICSGNKDRSPTAERLYSGRPDIEPKSAGIDSDARRVLSLKDLEWADLTLVMQEKHYYHIKDNWPNWLSNNKDSIRVLGIPDEYDYMDPVLIDEIEDRAEPKIERWLIDHRPPEKKEPCLVCGDFRETQRAHFPKRARDQGTETVPLCPLHHRVLDHGRIHRREMEALMHGVCPEFHGSVEEFVERMFEEGYPYRLAGGNRNMNKIFWDTEPADTRFKEAPQYS